MLPNVYLVIILLLGWSTVLSAFVIMLFITVEFLQPVTQTAMTHAEAIQLRYAVAVPECLSIQCLCPEDISAVPYLELEQCRLLMTP